MSGLEPLVALGLACNVMQLVSFGHETVSLCKRVYRTGAPEPGLAANCAHLAALSKSLGDELAARPSVRPNRADQDLLEVARRCSVAAKDLQEEANFLAVPENRKSVSATLGAAAKTMWRKRRLERLGRAMADAQKTMETSVLLRMSSRIDAGQLRQQEGFDKLDGDLQRFVQQLSAGQATLSQLVVRQSGDVKTHISSEAMRFSRSMEAHVAKVLDTQEHNIISHVTSSAGRSHNLLSEEMQKLKLEATNEWARERLLGSLKYPEMNERKNQIKPSHHRTFQWIFNRTLDARPEHSTPPGGGSLDIALLSDEDSGWETEDDMLVETSSASLLKSRSRSPVRTKDAAESAGRDVTEPTCRHGFVEFLESDQKTYWISGKPGSGKSTLVKFIISHEKTASALDRWRPGTRILSHFFWSPGIMMQRNIKGTLCSLFHQILSIDGGLAATLLEQHQHLRSKESPSDWATNELLAVLLEFFRTTSQHFCIFLDGVDEVCPQDGVDEVISLVGSLLPIPRLKICVSSRPEPAIVRSLHQWPRLKIHELTAPDLMEYASDTLRDHSATEDREAIYGRLIFILLSKAQGVFLWLVLAVKSLRRGIANGDDFTQLEARLRAMPSDLEKLYEDMWLRLGEDCAIYRHTAAIYFCLLLELGYDRDDWSAKSKVESCRLDSSATVFELAVASDDSLLATFLAEPTPSSGDFDRLRMRLEKTAEDIETRCAGLLEIRHYPGKLIWRASLTDSETYGDLTPYLEMGVEFLHRTARDFLCSTSTGQDILKSVNLSPPAPIRLFKANLIRCRLWFCYLHSGGTFNSASGFIGWMRNIDNTLEQPSRALMQELLQLCQKWYDMDKLVFEVDESGHSGGRLKILFDATAAAEGLGDIVLAYVESQSWSWNPKYLSILLQGTCSGLTSDLGYDREAGRLLRLLLSLGADPNHPPSTIAFRFNRCSPCMPYPAFGLALLSILISSLQSPGGLQDHAEDIFETLRCFVEVGVDLNSRVLIPIEYPGKRSLSENTGDFYLEWPSTWPYSMDNETMMVLESSIGALLDIVVQRLSCERCTPAVPVNLQTARMDRRVFRVILFTKYGDDFDQPIYLTSTDELQEMANSLRLLLTTARTDTERKDIARSLNTLVAATVAYKSDTRIGEARDKILGHFEELGFPRLWFKNLDHAGVKPFR